MNTPVIVTLRLNPGWNKRAYRYGYSSGQLSDVNNVVEWFDTPRLEMPSGTWWLYMQRRTNAAVVYAKLFSVSCSGSEQICRIDFRSARKEGDISGCRFTLVGFSKSTTTGTCRLAFRSVSKTTIVQPPADPTTTTGNPPISTGTFDPLKGIIGFYTDKSLLNLQIVAKPNGRVGLVLLSTQNPPSGRIHLFQVDNTWLTKAQLLAGEWERGYPILVQQYFVLATAPEWEWRNGGVGFAEMSITAPYLSATTSTVGVV